MIRVLQSQDEYRDAMRRVRAARLPLHATDQKNWDHQLLMDLLDRFARDSAILDMGSGDGFTLSLLHVLGRRNLTGLDLTTPGLSRRRRLVRLFKKPWAFRPERVIRRGDLTQTGLPGGSFDVVCCISVIEHGVDVPAFLAEASRLLRPGGLLVITTDYWEDIADDATAGHQIFGQPWVIQNRGRIEALVQSAQSCGLRLKEGKGTPPPCGQTTVEYLGFAYTFIALAFLRSSSRVEPCESS